ncbi:MAG: tRNA pseudouridine(38-40) synthase TruA [Clostridiales bacterium]|jgi:tRNA pseudouridine38-40 synthase|nr:tRNA pseudouridine(38-40) synthase TruA [Clostridiales bacterium]
MKILMTVAYDGTCYCGWQSQKNGVSVQEKLETALFSVYGEEVRVVGASRTDAGVHALGQSACFTLKNDYSLPVEKLPFAIRAKLPPDIVVAGACAVPDDFHPRFDAKEKTYAYSILNAPHPNPLLRFTAWHIYAALDLDAMKAAASHMVGSHDFACFCAAGSSAKTTVRTIYAINMLKAPNGLITVLVRGNAFLYNMARIIVGTLVCAGLGEIAPRDIAAIIESKDRKRAGKTAPPFGLTLLEVKYAEETASPLAGLQINRP